VGCRSLLAQNAIIYEVHVRAFFDSNADGRGDFRGLVAGSAHDSSYYGLVVSRSFFLITIALIAAGMPATFAAPTAGKPVDHIDYMAWDAPSPHWSAKIANDGKSFLCAPEGDWKRARPAAMINYLAPNGTEWSATIMDGRFVNSANGAGVSFESSEMTYRGWDGTNYSIRLDLKNKVFIQEAVRPMPHTKTK